jgi:hypothetical protein
MTKKLSNDQFAKMLIDFKNHSSGFFELLEIDLNVEISNEDIEFCMFDALGEKIGSYVLNNYEPGELLGKYLRWLVLSIQHYEKEALGTIKEVNEEMKDYKKIGKSEIIEGM